MLKYEIIKRMKTLRESLLDDDLVEKTDKSIKDEIKAFLKTNYNGSVKISRKPNTDGKYEVSSTKDVEVIRKNITSLTNGMFIWTTVNGSFEVLYCDSLKSLDGAPKEVGRKFNCSICTSLKSLEGAPKEVGGSFCCSSCDSLTSLKGAPEKVGGNFYCDYNKSLKSLEGAPKKVGGTFDCSGCKSLESLKGAPKEVGGSFNCAGGLSLKSLEYAPEKVEGNFCCSNCAGKFTIEDVKKISNVKGKIIC